MFGNTTDISIGENNAYHLGTYTYAPNNGLLTGMTYGNGDSVSYTYDDYGRKTQTTSSDGDSYRYRYSGDGQLWQMTDNAGSLNYQYSYDTLGRLIGSSLYTGSTLTLQTQHQYDDANRLYRQTWTLPGKSYQEKYIYDSHGRLNQKQLTLPGSASANIYLTYEDLSRVSAVNSPVYTVYYNYLASQNGTGTTGAVSQFSINPKTTNANRYKQLFFHYTYDELGNIASCENLTSDSALAEAVSYSYDNQSQLTQAVSTVNGTWGYQYDAYGNIRTKTHGTDTISYTYGDADWLDLLTAVSGTKSGTSFSGTYTYDGAGNPTSFYNVGDGTSWIMTWKNGRELASATNGTHTVSCDYDVSGLRTYKIVDGVRHDYVYASGQLLRESYTQSGTSYTLDFLYDHSGRPYMLNLTAAAAGGTTTTPYYYLLNLQGDVVEIVDADEAPVAKYTYDPYGNILTAAGTLANINPLRYRGYYYDTETGFYYLQSRYYDPALGRFINADGLASTGQGFLGYNMFAYCANNPNYHADKDGQDYEVIGAGIQVDLSASFGFIGGGAGVEVIVYWGTKEAEDNGGLVVAVYGYGGLSGDVVEGFSEIATIQDVLIDSVDLLKLDGVSALECLIDDLSVSVDVTVSGVLVTGDESFTKAEKYEGWFDTYSYNGLFVKAAYSWSDCCKTYSVGGKLFSTSSGGWGISRAKAYYKMLKNSARIIAEEEY